jgi:hypothetical protein
VYLGTGLAPGTSIAFSLALTDANGNRFTVPVNYNVTAIDQRFTFTMVAITDDDNNNQALSAGERGELHVQLRNAGADQARGIVGVVSTTSGQVTIETGSTIYFGHIASGNNRCGSASASSAGTCYIQGTRVRLAAGTTPGTQLSFSIALEDEYGNRFTVPFTVTAQ